MDKEGYGNLHYLKITKCSFCDGEGARVVLWVSGCTHNCKGCHNKDSWDFNKGELFGYCELSAILNEVGKPYIQGLTLSGGDPLHPRNRAGVSEIVAKVKEHLPSKDVWCYTGYPWEEIKDLPLMKNVDFLVDGEFELAKRDITLAFKGSTNQRIIDVQRSLRENKVVLKQLDK